MNLDAKRREYDIIVIGDEPHLAYNRVGLTSFFEHRKVENLYLNPQTWVCAIAFDCSFAPEVFGSRGTRASS
jgi:nitrite reductase (NAD(P)H)